MKFHNVPTAISETRQCYLTADFLYTPAFRINRCFETREFYETVNVSF